MATRKTPGTTTPRATTRRPATKRAATPKAETKVEAEADAKDRKSTRLNSSHS